MKNDSAVIVVPCFNEEQRLAVDRYWHFLKSNPDYSFVFVNDGSTDATETILKDFQRRCPGRIDVVSLPVNVGKAEAVRQGILSGLRTEPRYVGYWDADLATPLSELRRFHQTLCRQRDVNIVVGVRMVLQGHQINRVRYRRMLGKLFSIAASCVLSMPLRDTQCGAKMFA